MGGGRVWDEQVCVFTFWLPLEEGGESEYVKLLYVLAPRPVGGALLLVDRQR